MIIENFNCQTSYQKSQTTKMMNLVVLLITERDFRPQRHLWKHPASQINLVRYQYNRLKELKFEWGSRIPMENSNIDSLIYLLD